jgi:hypothetical protein
MLRRLRLLSLFGFLAATLSFAQNNLTQPALEARLKGKTLILRGMYDGRQLSFDAQGNLAGTNHLRPLNLTRSTSMKYS